MEFDAGGPGVGGLPIHPSPSPPIYPFRYSWQSFREIREKKMGNTQRVRPVLRETLTTAWQSFFFTSDKNHTSEIQVVSK